MRTMTNIEYTTIVMELQDLVGKRFDKIYKVPQGYRLKIADSQILIQPGIRLHRTKYIEEPEPADQFVQKVRAELRNSRLMSLHQVNQDRIVEFEFEHGRLVFEMFAKGNCILVKEGRTAAAMREESWSDREIRRGEIYSSPRPSIAKSFQDAISEKYVIISLLRLPLGKQYAQEILSRCGIDEKTPGVDLTAEQAACIEKGIESVKEGAKPVLFLDQGKPVDYGLALFSVHSGLQVTESATFSEALDEFYWHNREAKALPQLEKLEHRLAEQKGRLEELKREESELRAKGDYLYSNYGIAEKILAEANSIPLDRLEDQMKKQNGKVDKKQKSLEIDL